MHGGLLSSPNVKNIPTQAEKIALQLIARAEQTFCGLTRKLEKRGFDHHSISEVMDTLRETGLVDDHRFARLWLESRINRKSTSPWRLMVALCNRGISREDAHSALNELLDEDTELQLLQRYVFKKHPNIDAETFESLKYQLKKEGFSSQAINMYKDKL